MEERNRQRYRSKRIQNREAEERRARPNTEMENRNPRPRGERARRRRRRRRRQMTLRILICAALMVLAMLLAAILIMLGSLATKGVKGIYMGDFSLPWSKSEAVIMLDAGHGGKDQGTSYGDILEKELTLEITRKVEKLLKDAGYDVELTRTGDASMDKYDRVKYANRKKPDLFVSIHCNFLERGEASGIETYYAQDREEECRTLAEQIQACAVEKTGAVDRGVRTEDFVVVKDTEMPAALIEVGFLSDAAERELLQDEEYQEKLAQGIADGIISCWEAQKEEAQKEEEDTEKKESK